MYSYFDWIPMSASQAFRRPIALNAALSFLALVSMIMGCSSIPIGPEDEAKLLNKSNQSEDAIMYKMLLSNVIYGIDSIPTLKRMGMLDQEALNDCCDLYYNTRSALTANLLGTGPQLENELLKLKNSANCD